MVETRYHSLLSNFENSRKVTQNALAEFVTLV